MQAAGWFWINGLGSYLYPSLADLPLFTFLRRRKELVLADQAGIREAMADHMGSQLLKPAAVIILPLVEPEYLLGEITKQVEGLYTDIRALDTAL